MARNENKITIARALRIPFQILFALNRTPVVVHAKQREVEVISWEREVVGIAAEECHLLLWSKHEPYVGVFLVSVQPVLAALIERDDIGSKTRLIEAFLLNSCLLAFARGERLL